ncbi:Prenyltransferase family protein isoform 1 [Dorcoceras hygrometricum]|uniref:Prenyltransferase family protein isoform 1 n=1 Tax=Dorcoceras hygrometricum TaxID=472368 RepID=A0A2Z7BQ15_9LAMI|nr:Prenyltransferase family protein isoform 1 [Dorcoceras hygrometricum]
MAATNEPHTVAPFACNGRAMQAMVRAVAQPSVLIGPGGGPADRFSAKGGWNGVDERLVVGCGVAWWDSTGPIGLVGAVQTSQIEHARPLGSLDLNGAGDPAVDFMPTEGFPGYSAGRGVDPAGGAPGGG